MDEVTKQQNMDWINTLIQKDRRKQAEAEASASLMRQRESEKYIREADMLKATLACFR